MNKAKLIIFALIAVVFTVGIFFLPVDKFVKYIRSFVEEYSIPGIVTVIVMYGVFAVLLIPGSAITVLCGGVFGLVTGTIVVVLGSNLGAFFAFLISKTFLRSRVETWIEKYPKFKRLYSALEKNDFKIVFLTRLSPLFPYTLLNYFLGVAKVRLIPYLIASFIGMLPGTFLYIYIGVVATEVASSSSVEKAKLIFYIIGFVATILVVALVTQTAKKALSEELSDTKMEA